ncbi:hypothetical protein ACJIZ3_005888 [Penstemon smallii]|uniref:Uncharacterized protein n=1 Tax=Penstemon smallii TaxID=265156 RepID=A0ABD3S665_9LAMI
MERVDVPNEDVTNMGPEMMQDNAALLDGFKNKVNELSTKVNRLEQRVDEIERFYLATEIKDANTSRNSSIIKNKEEKHIPTKKKLQQDALHREAAASKRMQELMRQFGSIFRQITQHKWAWPFMQPVDVEGLGLLDYYKIIDRPMDFSTIKNQMEAKDGTVYKHVRDIYSDVLLVFKNAMKYNDENSDVYGMASILLEILEERWLQLLPKVTEEEQRREEEEAEAQKNILLAQEAVHAKMARDINNELFEVDMHLEELREMVVKKCRNISTMEKRNLGVAISKLCPEDLTKALEIVAQSNPNMQTTAAEVELDINAQSESTLWRLKFFVKDKCNDSSSKDEDTNNINHGDALGNYIVSKRKKEICDALAKTAKRRKKKAVS